MKKISYFLPFLFILTFSSCVQHAYYLSAITTNSNPYHAIPLQSDSITGATYVSGGITLGGANSEWRDQILAFAGSLHHTHSFGNFHAFYGGNMTVGTYNVASYRDEADFSPGMNASIINKHAGSKFFGAYGFNGGFNTTIPMKRGGEWRVIGLEGSAHNEFGDYRNFRKNLPDSAANVNVRNSWSGTIDVTTEVISKRRSGSAFGYKLGLGIGLNSIRNNYTYSLTPPVYVSNTLHFTKEHITAYGQINLGTYTGNFQFGVNYRLGKR